MTLCNGKKIGAALEISSSGPTKSLSSIHSIHNGLLLRLKQHWTKHRRAITVYRAAVSAVSASAGNAHVRVYKAHDHRNIFFLDLQSVNLNLPGTKGKIDSDLDWHKSCRIVLRIGHVEGHKYVVNEQK